MDLENERTWEENLADRLWRAVTSLQAMTDRLRTQRDKSQRPQKDDAYSLVDLFAV